VQRHDVAGGHGDALGKGAITVDPDDLGEAADVSVPGATLPAVPADDVAFGRHRLAHLELSCRLPTDLEHLAGEFMAQHHRRFDPPLGPFIPIGDVEVGSADAGVADANENV